MNTLHKAAQQALEALEEYQSKGAPFMACDGAIDALRAALAQQADPTDPGNDVDVLREHVRHLERRVRQLHAQQAEPVAGVVLNEEGRAALVEHGREEWHCVSRNARRLYTAPPQRKPLTQEESDNIYREFTLYQDRLTPSVLQRVVRAVERAHGIIEPRIKGDSHQTLDDAMRLPRAMAQAYERGYKAGQAHERERIIQFLQEMQRVVGDAHNHYGVAAMRIRERV